MKPHINNKKNKKNNNHEFDNFYNSNNNDKKKTNPLPQTKKIFHKKRSLDEGFSRNKL